MAQAFLDLRFPVYGAALVREARDAAEERVVVCGGGGDTKSGVKNKVCLLSCGASRLELAFDEVFSADYEAPNTIAAHPTKSIIVCDVKSVKEPKRDNLRFFRIGEKSFEFIDAAQTIDPAKEDDYQRCIAYSQDGTYLATGSSEGKLCLIKLDIKQPSVSSIDLGNEILSVVFTHNAHHVLTVTPKMIIGYKIADGKLDLLDLEILAPSEGEFRSGQFDSSMTHFYTLVNVRGKHARSVLTTWDIKTNTSLRSVIVAKNSTLCMSVSNDTIAIGVSDCSITFYSAKTLSYIGQLANVHDMPATSLLHISNGRYLVSTSIDGYVKLWKVKVSLTLLDPTDLETLGIPVITYGHQDGFLFNGNEMPFLKAIGLHKLVQCLHFGSSSSRNEGHRH